MGLSSLQYRSSRSWKQLYILILGPADNILYSAQMKKLYMWMCMNWTVWWKFLRMQILCVFPISWIVCYCYVTFWIMKKLTILGRTSALVDNCASKLLNKFSKRHENLATLFMLLFISKVLNQAFRWYHWYFHA